MNTPDSITFHGPFTFSGGERTIENSGFADAVGIYLWTLTDGENIYIHYIGETMGFAGRHKDHVVNILGMNYGIFHPDAAKRQSPAPIYPDSWGDKSGKKISNLVKGWYTHSKMILPYVESIGIYFAPTDCPKDVRRHIEGRVAQSLRTDHSEHKTFYPDDCRTGVKKERLGIAT